MYIIFFFFFLKGNNSLYTVTLFWYDLQISDGGQEVKSRNGKDRGKSVLH